MIVGMSAKLLWFVWERKVFNRTPSGPDTCSIVTLAQTP